MAGMQIDLITTVPDAGQIRDARACYAAAFGQAPYHETGEQAAGLDERLVRYAATRDGFRLVIARAPDGQPTGMALAVLAGPGDWWRDRAAAALTEAQSARWLGERCLEIVHVAVPPAAQRQGIGRAMHDVLISGRPAPTGLLSCHPRAEPAQQLYLSRGWSVLTTDFAAGDIGYWLMARDL
jgi:ribosomal protein S18 acetylase RimI-like enzyme